MREPPTDAGRPRLHFSERFRSCWFTHSPHYGVRATRLRRWRLGAKLRLTNLSGSVPNINNYMLS
jgi:hypothetical protein